MKSHPIPMRSPEALIELADKVKFKGDKTSERIVALVQHFLNSNRDIPDLTSFPSESPKKAFTLRLPKKDLTNLETFAAQHFYTRQQAIHVAMFAALLELGFIG